MIDISQTALLGLIIRSFLCGVVLGVIYGFIKITRILLFSKEMKNNLSVKIFKYIFIFIGDMLLGVLVGLISVLLIYHINGGIFRGMVYLFLFFGFMLYRLTFARLIEKMIIKLLHVVFRVMKKIFKVLFLPFKLIFRGLFFIYHLTIGKIIGKIIISMKKRQEIKREKERLPEIVTEYGSDGSVSGECAYDSPKERYGKVGRISFGSKRQN